MVPLGSDGSRHTTLGLLTKAKQFIKNLEERDKRQSCQKQALQKRQVYMRRKVDLLARDVNLLSNEIEDDDEDDEDDSSSFDDSAIDVSSEGGAEGGDIFPLASSPVNIRGYLAKRRSVSESSGFSTESSNSSTGTSLSESDEIDILGYVSPPSGDDSDEVSSNRSSFSLSSGGSVVISTRRLTLKEEILNAKTLSL